MTPAGKQQTGAARPRRARGGSVVGDGAGLGVLIEDLRSRERVHAVVGVAWSADDEEPVIPTSQIRTVIDLSASVYVVKSDVLLGELRRRVGPRLALAPGAIRVWWPGVTRRSDPGDHPQVVPLEGESPQDVLAELARVFHLSRPDVRRELKLAEDARALAEHNQQEAERKDQQTAQLLRDAHVERDREATRADESEEAAENARAALAPVKRQLKAASGLAGVGRQLGLQALYGDAAEEASIRRAFGERVEALRAEAGLTQVELAPRCFLRTGQVSLLERGERIPNLLILQVLARALDVQVADLTAGLPLLTRQAGRERMRALIAKTPRSKRHGVQLAQASGLPRPYAAELLHYMEAFGEITNQGNVYELTQHPAGGANT